MLFIESVPMRPPHPDEVHEVRRIFRKLRHTPRLLRTVYPGLHVLRPLPIPPAGALGRRLQLAELRSSVERACRVLGLNGPRLSWFSLPNAAPLVGRLGEQASLLYYQDRYDAFNHVDGRRLRAHVAKLALECDLAIATASELAADLRSLGADPVLIPHGVEVERFARPTAPPADLRMLERPLIGCVGLIDDYVSIDAILAVAEALERGTVVMVGGANVATERLRHPRVALLGRRPYEEMPAYLQAFDVCLVPFVVNRLTLGVNPIKLREYLAAGRPVVSTDLPELRPYADVVELVSGPDAFPAAVERALAEGLGRVAVARRQQRVAGESWDVVAALMEEHIWSLMDRRDGRPQPSSLPAE